MPAYPRSGSSRLNALPGNDTELGRLYANTSGRYTEAHYFQRNLRMMNVLIDQDAIKRCARIGRGDITIWDMDSVPTNVRDRAALSHREILVTHPGRWPPKWGRSTDHAFFCGANVERAS